MVTLAIVRHGYSKYNEECRFTGQRDIPLNDIVIRQAEFTAK